MWRIVVERPDAGTHPSARSKPLTFRIHRWVLWWVYVGVICGVVVVANMLFRDLPRAQERILLFTGVAFWLLGGLVCWACEGIRTENPEPSPPRTEPEPVSQEKEWHAASEFLLPGGGHPLLPPAHTHPHRELLDAYILRHREEAQHHRV